MMVFGFVVDGQELFGKSVHKPLADFLRPNSIEEIVGQDHLLGCDGPIGKMLAARRLPSMILYGPPGCGKTTLARLLSVKMEMTFEALSAVFSGVADLRRIFEWARERRKLGNSSVLFIDEIHRFNRAQQDSFLPYVEDGTVILVGATTENPSFQLNAALLSRMSIFTMHRLDHGALSTLIARGEAATNRSLPLDDDAREMLVAMADGDGRYVLNMVEMLFSIVPADSFKKQLYGADELLRLLQRRAPLYDKNREEHYNLISALHKSMRASDVDAALYWLQRMLIGGEDPHYIARRLLRFASEDIGLADPGSLSIALAAWQSYERLGSPEGELALAEAVLYLASAPKSNAVYVASKTAAKAARSTGSLTPPKHSLNAPTKFMKETGYGLGYCYDHNEVEAFSGQSYFPDGMPRQRFYNPPERGYEREICKRLNYWAKLRSNLELK